MTNKTNPPGFRPYDGQMTVRVNYDVNLSGMDLKDIIDFRIRKVNEYSSLNIFPRDYIPLKKIYASLTSGAYWDNAARFYIANPYLLIILSFAGYVRPLSTDLYDIEVKYSNRAIYETYTQENTRKVFHQLYYQGTHPGVIRINMVNAFDAGLIYASIDKERSKNIDFKWNNSIQNISNGIYSQSGFYHFGRGGKNNLSPADPNGRIKLIGKDTETIICIKLYREKPGDIEQKEDFTYIVRLIP